MSSLTKKAPAAVGAPAPRAEDKARFRDVAASEWIKFWSLRSTTWVLLLCAAAVIATNVDSAVLDYHHLPHYTGDDPADFGRGVALRDAFTQAGAMMYLLGLGSLGGITIAGEYGTGLIRTTFAAVPDRRAVVLAKVAVVVPVLTAFGAVVALTSFWSTQAVLSGRHAGQSLTDPPALRIVLAGALLAPVAALAGMAIGAILRHSAATMVAGAFILLLLPTSLISEKRRWSADILHAMPFSAWERLVNIDGWAPPGVYPATIRGAWLTYAIWPAACILVTTVTTHHRDL